MTLRVLRAPEDAELTLVLLHHAGGSSAGFRPFVPHLPESWRLVAVDLPNRLLGPAGVACRSTATAVEHLLRALGPELTGPYAVFGHSLGGLLAYELVRELERRGSDPHWLGVSGFPAPAVPRATRDEVVAAVGGPVRLGGRDKTISAVVEARYTRLLRADLEIVRGYTYRDGPPLRTALTVFHGDTDPMTPVEVVRPWSGYAGTVDFHAWPGGHFGLFDQPAAVCRRMVEACARLAPV
ncbi:alpha/beta fold hydrolase [Actinoplanes sp. NPDC049596]|uniref:thioesterase II family protein n=1 Tax=unclassified Actinoplanes TaxID=2626549 RepID=UPI003419FBB7